MDINTTDIMFLTNKKLPDISCEQSIDTDFTLPDYYPEVSKILKCLTEVGIMTKQVNDGVVEIGGQAVITLIYADSDNGINSFTHTYPFTKSVEVAGATENSFISVVTRSNLINSKATAPRKLEIHGSCTLVVSVSVFEKQKVLSCVEDDNIYSRCKKISYNEPIEPISKSVFIEDEIHLGQNQPSVAKIIRHSAKSRVSECKFISGKAVIKGDLFTEILYCGSQSNKPMLITEQHGFSQIIDCDGLDENTVCDCISKVLSFELHPKTSIDGEVRTIAFESKVCLDIFPTKSAENAVVTDAFSGCFVADAKKMTIMSEHIADSISENYVCKKNLDFSDGMVSEIYDLWCRCTVDYASGDGGDVLIKGSVIIYILGVNSDNEPVFYERPIDYEYRYAVGETNGKIRCKPNVTIAAVNYSQNQNGEVDVAAELSVKTTVYTAEEINVLCDISIDDAKIVDKDTDTAVILYFAEGETVWEIARKYCTSPEKILTANNLENYDTVCNKMLLIPNV